MTSEEVRAVIYNQVDTFNKLNVPSLKNHGYHYASVTDFVLQEGEVFSTVTKAPRLGKPQNCYQNCTDMVLDEPLLYTYVEGFYINPKLPILIHHAWVVTPDGTVVEPTLRWRGKTGVRREGHGFMGVRINSDLLLSAILQTRTYGVIDDYPNSWPLLREKFDPTILVYPLKRNLTNA